MSYYRTCCHCGAHLDPGETCDCRGSLMAEIMAMSEPECSLLLGAIRIYQQHPDWSKEQCNALCKLAGGAIGGVVLLASIHMIGAWAVAWAAGMLLMYGFYRLFREGF